MNFELHPPPPHPKKGKEKKKKKKFNQVFIISFDWKKSAGPCTESYTLLWSIFKVEVYAQLSEGHMFITNNGGNGNQGQAGADGKNGEDRLDAVRWCKSDNCLARCNHGLGK